MQTTRLGKTELQVPRIGFGGIPIQRLTEEEAVKVVRRCLDLGVTFLDTANAYTTSEGYIGKAIAGRRDQVILATKTAARDKATALEHLELSLKQLQTDYIDLWQLHNVSTEAAFEQILAPGGAMEAAREALQSGKIRHLGVTSHSLDVAIKMTPTGHFETVQVPLNFVTDEALAEMLPLARQHDLGFIAMKPLAGGLLDNANLAIKWLLQFEGVVPDPGIERVSEIEEIVRIVEGSWELSAEERQEIDRIRAEAGTRFCRRCQYCLPCPQGIKIPVMMNVRSFMKRFSETWYEKNNFAAVIDTARTCIDCGQCEERCPYHLPIREMLAENIAYYEEMVS